jgi:uncharacterized protein (DUF1778 family)
MAPAKARRRLVNFRLTQDEYDHLKEASSAAGAHSLSDFARTTLLTAVDPSIYTTRSTQSITRQIDRLQSSIRLLSALLERFPH